MVVGGYSRLPNSCLKVLKVLDSSKSINGISQKEIIAETMLSVRSIKYALTYLEARGLVFSKLNLNDTRRKQYFVEVGDDN